MLTFLGGDIEATVAHREVDAAVGARNQAVEVVAVEAPADAEAVGEALARISDEVVVGVGKGPEVRDAGVVERVVEPHHPGADAVELIVEAAGEDPGGVGDAVAVGVGEDADAVLGGGEAIGREGAARDPAVDLGAAVLDALELEVILDGVEVRDVAGVGDGDARAVGLGDIEVALRVEADRDRGLHHALGGPDVDGAGGAIGDEGVLGLGTQGEREDGEGERQEVQAHVGSLTAPSPARTDRKPGSRRRLPACGTTIRTR